MKLKIFNAAMMIISTSVGVGILGLPIVTSASGLVPTWVAFVVAWVFMTLGAFHILEVKMVVKGHYSLASMIKITLGRPGHYLASCIILLLLYALLSTYLMAALAWLHLLMPVTLGIIDPMTPIVLIFVFSFIILSSTRWLYHINNVLGICVLLAFVATIASSLTPNMSIFAQHASFVDVLPSLPLLLTTFGFSIVVPAVTEYLNYDKSATKTAVLWGSIVSLFAYAIWEWVTLGHIPLEGLTSFDALKQRGDNGTGVIMALAHVTHHPWVIIFGKLFAILLVITSFLGISLALLHFLADLLKIKSHGKWRFFLALLMYIPPLCVTYFYPKAFVQLLSFAGIFVALLLGLFPAWMVFKLRQDNKYEFAMRIRYRCGLVMSCLFFILVIVQEIINLYV